MGNSTSTHAPLSSKEATKLSAEFTVTAEGLGFLYSHYHSLLNHNDLGGSDGIKRWLLEKCFENLIMKGDNGIPPTFKEYLTALMDWRAQSTEQRIEFYFDLLDYNTDNIITASDISVFLQESAGYKFVVGDVVRVRNENREGKLAYIGKTGFAIGKWAGILFDTPAGKNDGTVDGVRYFEAGVDHGLFVQFSFIELESHWRQAKLIVDQFGAGGGISRSTFTSRLLADEWIMSRLMVDPLKAAYILQAN